MTESKKKNFFKKPAGFVVGTIFGISLTTAGVAFADSINADFPPLHFFVNGVEKTPANNSFQNGASTVPASMIYDGTTYVPIRLVSNMLGTPINWDGANNAIRIGLEPSGTYLSDMNPFYVNSNLSIISNSDTKRVNDRHFYQGWEMDLAGKAYAKGIAVNASSSDPYSIDYNLDGKFKSMSFDFGLDDGANANSMTVTISGDGSKLWSGTVDPGSLPKHENIDLPGVQQLEISVSGAYDGVVDIVNPVLTPSN